MSYKDPPAKWSGGLSDSVFRAGLLLRKSRISWSRTRIRGGRGGSRSRGRAAGVFVLLDTPEMAVGHALLMGLVVAADMGFVLFTGNSFLNGHACIHDFILDAGGGVSDCPSGFLCNMSHLALDLPGNFREEADLRFALGFSLGNEGQTEQAERNKNYQGQLAD